jgi:hypothetical protein
MSSCPLVAKLRMVTYGMLYHGFQTHRSFLGLLLYVGHATSSNIILILLRPRLIKKLRRTAPTASMPNSSSRNSYSTILQNLRIASGFRLCDDVRSIRSECLGFFTFQG